MSKIRVAVLILAVSGIVIVLAVGKSAPSQGVDLGPLFLRFYSLTFLAGIFLAWFVASLFSSRFGIDKNHLENLIILSALGGLIGARIHHVFSEWNYYSNHSDQIVRFWQGGLGFFGGIAGAFVATYIYSKFVNLNYSQIACLLSLVAPLGQAIGRWGNFFNQEIYGSPSSLPWSIFIDQEHRVTGYQEFGTYHPFFLYEFLCSLAIFLILSSCLKIKSINPLKIFSYYLVLYPFARFQLEFFRIDASQIYGMNLNQVLSLIVIFVGVIFLLFTPDKNIKRMPN